MTCESRATLPCQDCADAFVLLLVHNLWQAAFHHAHDNCLQSSVCLLLQRALGIESNNMTGSLPMSWIKQPTNLQYLSLSVNALSGTVPDSWSSVSQVSQAALDFASVQHGQESRSGH